MMDSVTCTIYFYIYVLALFFPFTFFVQTGQSHEISGFIETESRYFASSALFAGQKTHNGSFALEAEYYHQWRNDVSFTFTLFGRQDSSDSNRSHLDIREAQLLFVTDAYELRAGIGKVFWGATEFLHLVDIINQTDLVEEIDGEDKLGQPMIQLSIPGNRGVIDLFVLPFFRERTFPGRKGRLRTRPEITVDHPRYESGSKDRHVDLAARYSRTLDDMDIGIGYFRGTGREPTLMPEIQGTTLSLVPYYPQISQTSFDLQWAAGNWLWKMESLYRHGQGRAFLASIGGFEYTFFGIGDTGADIGLLMEYGFDDRGDNATTFSQNDIMAGLRLAFNDISSTQLLAGVICDLDGSGNLLSLEGSRRIGENWNLLLSARFFHSMAEDDVLYPLHEDDYLRLQLRYYF